jgi:ABC-type sulfate/molybdate transport systems ATPase subunit
MHARAGYGALTGMLGGGSAWQAEKQLAERADAILDMLGLQAVRDQRVGGQSYGTLKLLELGCALATDPDILLLDEPTSGMGPDESDELGERLLTLRREFGLTMLVIEHHVPLVLRVCDHVYVLNFGQLLAEGPPSVIQTHPEVVAAYLGGSAPDALEQTVETAEDAELDAQLEHAVHEHDVHEHDGHEQDAEPQVDQAPVVRAPSRSARRDLVPADPPTDELPLPAGAPAAEQSLRPRRRRVPAAQAGGSQLVGEGVPERAPAESTDTLTAPARPARKRTPRTPKTERDLP